MIRLVKLQPNRKIAMMKIRCINYDLKAPGRNYQALYNAIKNVSGYWAHASESFWLVKTSKTSTQVRDELKQHLDRGDVLVVAEFSSWASFNLKPATVNWLNGARAA